MSEPQPKKMLNIAVVAPLAVEVPPREYGGTERVVSWIVEPLVKLGHNVTLYAAGESQTAAKLIICSEKGLWALGRTAEECKAANLEMCEQVLSCKNTYDIVHMHQDAIAGHTAIVERYPQQPVIWTDHCDLAKEPAFSTLKELTNAGVAVTALSAAQKSTGPDVPYVATIHHGLPADLLKPDRTLTSSQPPYLAFLGRISPEKGIIPAVRIASQAGMELKVAAKIDFKDSKFYKTEVEELFATSKVTFIGQIADKQKPHFLSNAHALLFPISWNECFGLVMIEAMACGCPVIAYRQGAVPEVIEDGLTGYIVDNETEAAEAVGKVSSLDRARIRRRFEERFVADIMVAKYVKAYERTIDMYERRFNNAE